MTEQFRVAAQLFITAPSGARLRFTTTQCLAWPDRVVQRADHSASTTSAVSMISPIVRPSTVRASRCRAA